MILADAMVLTISEHGRPIQVAGTVWERVRPKTSAMFLLSAMVLASVPDPEPDPPDPHVFGPSGSVSGSTSQRYGFGSPLHHAKIVRKTLIPSIL
jgi:hypothetical protein